MYGGTNITSLRLIDPTHPDMQKLIMLWSSPEHAVNTKFGREGYREGSQEEVLSRSTALIPLDSVTNMSLNGNNKNTSQLTTTKTMPKLNMSLMPVSKVAFSQIYGKILLNFEIFMHHYQLFP